MSRYVEIMLAYIIGTGLTSIKGEVYTMFVHIYIQGVCMTPSLNRLYVRLNGIQLTSNTEIDQLHVISFVSIFTKLFSKDLNCRGIE